MEKVFGDDDLLEEILLRLPAEIVHGCKPVSKHWCNLISSQSFRRRHGTSHLHLPSSSKILLIDHGKGSATTLLDVRNGVMVIKTSNIDSDKLLSSIKPFYEKLLQKADESKEIEYRICDVYNGLVLVSLQIKDRGRNLFSYRNQGEVHYLVCNPLTKEYQELCLLSEHKLAPFTELAFAPSPKPCGYYKIIVSYSVPTQGDYTDSMVQVYSSETRTWKNSGHLMDKNLYDCKYVVWDNCLLLVYRGSWRGSVCVLDSEKLCVSQSSSLLPNFIFSTWKCMINYFGESGGFLYVIVNDTDNENSHYRLWEMESVNGSWKEKFQFKIEKDTRPLYVHREGEHVWLLLLKSGTVYYCLDGNTERLEEAGDVLTSYPGWNIRSYTATLFPLRGLSAVIS